ncbi:MAG: exopolysaccharide biosynthesis polyprenyl glycosylphosphotransferase [Sphingobacteriaceae bacterium]
MKLRESYVQLGRIIVDVVLLNLAIILLGDLRTGKEYANTYEFIIHLFHGNILLLFSYLAFSLKVINLRESYWTQAVNIIKHALLFTALSAAITFLFLPDWFPRQFILQCTLLYLLLKLLFYGLLHLYLRFLGQGELETQRIAILGTDDTALMLCKTIESKPLLGYEFIGFIADKQEDNAQVIGRPEKLVELIDKHRIQMIFAPLSVFETDDKKNSCLKVCNSKGVRLWYAMENQRWIKSDFNTIKVGDLVLMNPTKIPLDHILFRLEKRVFDILFSTLVITLLLSWLLPILALFIKLGSKGPVFFIQRRTGINNKSFYCVKLRTMQINPEADVKQATVNDPRTTALGRFLRHTNMDELPQFFNVFVGQMSVVGPRPHMLKHTEQYAKLINHYLTRHFVKPGITGWAQINGYRGETSELWMMEKRINCDTKYIRNWSLWWDIKIIWLTVFGRNFSKNAH